MSLLKFHNIPSEKNGEPPIQVDVEVLQKIYPMSVVTMLSAYYYYGLTDNVPDKIHLSVERNGTKIKDSNVVTVSEELKARLKAVVYRLP